MRLIDADELLKENFTETFVDPCDQPIFEWIIEQTPTIDAVPVVRCKDCKYRSGLNGLCSIFAIAPKDLLGRCVKTITAPTENGGRTMKVYKHGTYDYITIVEIPKKKIKKIDFALCKQPKETLKSFYDRQEKKPDFIINGGIFHLADGQTYFNYRDEGETISGWHWYTAGMGIADGELKYGGISTEKWTDFVSAYPPLIVDGKALPIEYANELDGNKRRSILAYNADTVFLIAVGLPGLPYNTIQKVLLVMGVDYAIALDGGGSTKILQDGKSITSTLYNRPVDNVVAVWLKDLKRIQVGAWKNKLYATAMLLKVRALPDPIKAGYKNARLVYVDGWWKVQVGAFYDDAGVQRVVNDLATHGITGTYITKE